MTNGRVTMAVLGEKVDTLGEKIEEMCRQYNVDHERVTINTQRINTLEAIATRPVSTCPVHQATIGDITDLKIKIAQMGAVSGMAGGGAVGVMGMILFAIGRLMKWW
jgi:hypothetical protein